MRVARCAELLAARHGADPSKARLAGLLHDAARLFPPDRLLAECRAREMPVDAFELAHPMLLHARLGAALARERFGVTDPEVLSAIEKHTAGAGEMSPLDCIVYLADSLEPARSFAGRQALWSLAMHDLDEAMRAVLLATMRHNARKGYANAPGTLAAARRFGVTLSDELQPEVGASAN